jgi:predicted nucleic acid-binding protein
VILILDASALIVLARIGSLQLLRELADQIVIPDAVYEESVRQGQGKPGSSDIAHADWIVRQPALDQSAVMRLRRTLGQGEAEAIVLAQQIHAVVVLDDAVARRMAKQEGCQVVGLIGLLTEAKQRGLIPAVKPLLDAMRGAHFFIGNDLYATIMRQVGE